MENQNINTNNEKKSCEKCKALNIIYKVFVVLALIAIILLILFKPCNCNCNCHQDNLNDTYFNTDIDDSISDEATSNVEEDLNKQVEDGMITMSMNANPVFQNGSSKGNLLIENDKSNKHPQIVQIYRNEDNKLLYTSGVIPIGKFVNEAPLDVKLPKGEYECTAYFNAVDEKTGEKLGQSGANITIHILN